VAIFLPNLGIAGSLMPGKQYINQKTIFQNGGWLLGDESHGTSHLGKQAHPIRRIWRFDKLKFQMCGLHHRK